MYMWGDLVEYNWNVYFRERERDGGVRERKSLGVTDIAGKTRENCLRGFRTCRENK